MAIRMQPSCTQTRPGCSEECPEILGILQRYFRVKVTKSLGSVAAWKKPFVFRSAARVVREELVTMERPQRVLVCNGQRAEVYGLRGALRREIPVDFVEDGLDAYMPATASPMPGWRARAHRWVFAEFWPSDMMELLPFEHHNVVAPELFRARVGPSTMKFPPLAWPLQWRHCPRRSLPPCLRIAIRLAISICST